MKKWSVLLIIAVVALLMPMSAAMVNAQEEASLSINKSADTDSATVGETVNYTYTITNNSDNVTINNITLVDSNTALGNQGKISLSKATLGPNESVTANATYTVEEKDLPGPLVNTATVSGTDPDSNPVTASATASVDLAYTASLQLTKVADRETASFKETIKYTYTITNTGNVALSNITLADDKIPEVSLLSDNITLAPGGNITATATHTVAEADLPGPIENTATASGTDPDGNAVTDNATASVELTSPPSDEVPSIGITKEADRETASFKETITYTYTITNTGDGALSKITLVDDKLGKISLGGSDNMTIALCRPNNSLPWRKYHQHGSGSDNITLAPGDTVSVTATYTVSFFDLLRGSTIINKATVKGTDPTGKRVTASATATVSVNKSLFWKRHILKHSGIPGKGIDKAPGLQKPFNPKSKAAEHAGKKDGPKTQEQLQTREREENQSSEDHLRIRSEVENQAGSGEGTQGDDEDEQANQNDDEDRDGNWQLKKFSGTDNQTQVQQATQGNGHKPDNDKPKNNPKAGNNH